MKTLLEQLEDLNGVEGYMAVLCTILAYLENKARVGAIRCGLRRGITWNFTSLSKTQEFLQI